MRIAFVGKGGSGKSTVSWLFANHLAERDKVLAIDADYNLDLLHNFQLNEKDVPHFMNTSEQDFYTYLGLTERDYYIDIPNKENLPRFNFSQPDSFTSKYSFAFNENIRLMIAGMVPQEMLYGHRCGHAYISSLKYYVPLLNCHENEHVVIDSVAGTDLVSYGMFLGCDAVAVVVEETSHSAGVFEQIHSITKTFSIPTFIVLNKYRGSGKIDVFIEKYASIILGKIPFSENILDYDYSLIDQKVRTALLEMREKLEEQCFSATALWERHVNWRKKYDIQLEENKNKKFNFLE